MKKLFKNGKVINVFLEQTEEVNLLVEDERIIGVGDYQDNEADMVIDCSGLYLSPGFIDGHIHIESTMLSPYEFAKEALKHGTTAVISDPHEIANVCGVDGIKYMIDSSEGLPLDVYVMLPSCVPATGFDESYEEIDASKLDPLFNINKRVLGLAELMNYVGAINGDPKVLDKINLANHYGKLIDGHAPMLRGKDLDKYISLGINSDHECVTLDEARERIAKGQWLMIRHGTAAKNLHDMLPLFDDEARSRCLFVTDDLEIPDISKKGYLDHTIYKALSKGKKLESVIQVATINAAKCFRLEHVGALAPNYYADIVLIDDIQKMHIKDVYKHGKLVVKNHETLPFDQPLVSDSLHHKVFNSMNCNKLEEKNLYIKPEGKKCHVIGAQSFYLTTEKLVMDLDFSKNNGVDIDRDILKISVVERHKNTSHIGLGFINGIGLKMGAIASTVSHDSHNIIAIGTNDKDMALAINRIREIGGGNVIVQDGKVIKELSLPIAGLMSDKEASEVAKISEEIRETVHLMGVPKNVAPFMNMAFVSLPVIPSLKLTTLGLVDVDQFKQITLFVKED